MIMQLALVLAFVLAMMPGEVAAGGEKTMDNSFLIEEAYNQEPGVIQHIQVMQFMPRGSTWGYSFTEEWPVPTDRHQISVTVPLLDGGAGAGPGDLLLNYRFQALGMGGEGMVALAPRISAVIPSGDAAAGRGRGGVGAQVNLPVSVDLHQWFTMHFNAGASFTPRAKIAARDANDVLDLFSGASGIWTLHEQVNIILEGLYTVVEKVDVTGARAHAGSFTLNPGIRGALNFETGGLQVVPGASLPIVFTGAGREIGALLYLSFEHRAWREQGASANDHPADGRER